MKIAHVCPFYTPAIGGVKQVVEELAKRQVAAGHEVHVYTSDWDKKGRISFPSLFRNALSKANKNEIILYKSLKHNSVEGCSVQRINEIAKRINSLDFFSEDQEDFSTSIFSDDTTSSNCISSSSFNASSAG